MKRGFKRRTYPIVSRNRQYRALLLILSYALTLCAVLFAGLFVPEIMLLQNEGAALAERAAAADRLLSLHARLWPVVVAIVCLIGLHSFRMFSRFIGPLFRFRWAFEVLGDGDLTRRVHLRNGDELGPEADQYNAAMDALSIRVAAWREAVDRVAAACERLAGDSGVAGERTGADLGVMQERVARLQHIAAGFTLPDAPPPEGDAG